MAELASPVPDFAATLITPAEQEAHDENVSFLRTPIPPSVQESFDNSSRRRSAYLNSSDVAQVGSTTDRDRERQRRFRRSTQQQRQRIPAHLQGLNTHRDSAPIGQVATTAPEGYQGWAPGSADVDFTEPEDARGYLRSLARYRREMDSNEERRRYYRERVADLQELLELNSAVTERVANRDPALFDTLGWDDESQNGDPSVYTQALLQSVQRTTGFSQRSRQQLQNYILDRERGAGRHEDPEARISRLLNTTSSTSHVEPGSAADYRQRTQVLRHRHNRLVENGREASRWLEETIKYLERLRFCDTYPERISSAAAGGFVRGEFFTHNSDDFILDTTTIAAPAESSWLRPGGVFSGEQHASGTCRPTYHITDRGSTSNRSERTTIDMSHRRSAPQSGRTFINGVLAGATDCSDSWPVKVTINSIDYESMTLSGTMEASDVPNKSIPPQESSITTFLEGEIIDFNKYTLETKSFTADASVDSTYWRQLEPFRNSPEKEIVSNLVSQKWLSEELGQKWILMRWKGWFCSASLKSVLRNAKC